MQPRLLIFTDLDGTLLDHDSYAWHPAAPALARLAELKIPLILNSSKTAREIHALRRELNNQHPYVVENGGAVCIPGRYFPPPADDPQTATNEVHTFGPRYALILQTLRDLRRAKYYSFEGFADFGIEGIMRTTGLDRQAAELAGQRLCTEPLLWHGRADELEAFRRDLAVAGLQLVKGGRFLHVMGRSDKGSAMQWLTERFRRTDPKQLFRTVALGDGQNDLPMLEAADIAVVIRPKHGTPLQLEQHDHVWYPATPGPAGWQEAMEQILNQHKLS